jgi:hypothetical protein
VNYAYFLWFINKIHNTFVLTCGRDIWPHTSLIHAVTLDIWQPLYRIYNFCCHSFNFSVIRRLPDTARLTVKVRKDYGDQSALRQNNLLTTLWNTTPCVYKVYVQYGVVTAKMTGKRLNIPRASSWLNHSSNSWWKFALIQQKHHFIWGLCNMTQETHHKYTKMEGVWIF